jgi:predicted dehydrogenase
VKLGIIGLSAGNGHPFSWSAIINGYERLEMEKCGFPSIPEYLASQKWPEDKLQGSKVSAVWTQNIGLSKQIAAASKIEEVCEDRQDMLGKVDAVLLARDDAENHLAHSREFLEAGLPVFIDKPLALNLEDLASIYKLEQYPGQIFSCSALRFSEDMRLSEADRESLGKIVSIDAKVPKDWSKYAIHAIEPILQILDKEDQIMSSTARVEKVGDSESTEVLTHWESGIVSTIQATGLSSTPIEIQILGSSGRKKMVFTDTFNSFKNSLETFIEGAEKKSISSPRYFNERAIDVLERGIRN